MLFHVSSRGGGGGWRCKLSLFEDINQNQYYINIIFFTGDIVDCHPEETLIVGRGGAEVDNAFRG